MNIFEASWWRGMLINAFITAIAVIILIIIVSIGGEDYWRKAPVDVVSLQGVYLGDMCPGQLRYIHNRVVINKPVTAIYYVSVMDRNRLYNFIGTQVIYNGVQHPIPGTFTHLIEWVVPNLPPGTYARSFAARGTDGTQKNSFAYNLFTIPQTCFLEDTNATPNSMDRIPEDPSPSSYRLDSHYGNLAHDTRAAGIDHHPCDCCNQLLWRHYRESAHHSFG